MVQRLALASTMRALAETGAQGSFRVGAIERITSATDAPRQYVVDSRPMPALRTGEQATYSRGTEVLWWDGPVPFILGPVVTD